MRLKLHKTKQFTKQWLLIISRYSFIPALHKGKPAIIIMFDNTMQHGGLLDRIKGIISAKLIADELQYDFHIYTDSATFDLFRYLKPCDPDMPIQKSKLVYNIWSSRPVIFYNVFNKSKATILQLFRSSRQYHFYCNVDLLKQIYPRLSQDELHQKWRWYFRRLFCFDEYFNGVYQQLFSGSNVIGIHLRFQSLLGDATEDALVLDKQSGKQLMQKCTNAIERIIEDNNKHQCLIVSDSAIFLDVLKNRQHTSEANIIISGGAIGHIDFVHEEAVLQKALTDFYLLSRCSAVYQVLEPRMYNSQFSKYAAILGNAPYYLVNI